MNKFIQLIIRPWVKYVINVFLFRKDYDRPVNLLKTIYVNLKCLPLCQAIRFPILVYNRIEIYRIGKMQVEGPVHFGMIKIGGTDFKVHGKGKIFNTGKIVFRGPVQWCGGGLIENRGIIILNENIFIGPGTTFLIANSIDIGRYTSIGFNCFFMDTDDHYMIHVIDRCVHRFSSPIIIGSYSWMGAYSYCKKGVRLPDYTIVASTNTLLVKDYTMVEPYSVLGGAPAKVIATNVRRIFNMKEQRRLMECFRNTLEKEVIVDVEDMNDYCLSNFF